MSRVCELVAEVRAAARAQGDPEPIGIGISAPGPLDPWRGVVVAPPNLAAWRNVPLAELVEERIGLPTFVERDTNVAVQCEWRYGAARGTATAVYVTVSTGIGGGIILGGRPLLGPDDSAGEVGHVTIELDGPLCGDGSAAMSRRSHPGRRSHIGVARRSATARPPDWPPWWASEERSTRRSSPTPRTPATLPVPASSIRRGRPSAPWPPLW